MNRNDAGAPHIIVIGAGIAGLSAAVSAKEKCPQANVEVIERGNREEFGGLTRWTAAYLRLDEIDKVADGFVDDVVSFSGERSPRWYAELLAERIPETMRWIVSLGGKFGRLPTYFINARRQRLQPLGGGASLLDVLVPVALDLGVKIYFETTVVGLRQGKDGRISGVDIVHAGASDFHSADSVIIAAGGFEGSPEMLDEHLGQRDLPLVPIAPGAHFNRGELISAAVDLGAGKSGAWDDFHAEPVDPRADHAEAIVMGFNYGILVDGGGKRFTDEGRGTIDETYEETARRIWNLPGGLAWFITDQHYIDDVSRGEEGILSRVPPIEEDSIDGLALALELPVAVLTKTVREYNDSTSGAPIGWEKPDGVATDRLEPPKSNWAFPLDRGPYRAYPVVCAIVFTYGGLATDERSRVIDTSGKLIPGLYAAGECTGLYHGKYPGGTSVLRGMVFGRIAGRHAVGHSDV